MNDYTTDVKHAEPELGERHRWPLVVATACLLFAQAALAEEVPRLRLAHATGHDAHEHHHGGPDQKSRRSVRTYKVPEVTLIDMNGTKVPLLSALRDDTPLLLNFVFTTCTSICPVMSATFAEAQKQLIAEGYRVRMISISIDPEHDSPERLRAFARRHDAVAGWQFLTGSAADIVAVQRAFDAYRGNKMSHSPGTYVRLSAADQWVRFEGLTSAADLVAEYRRAVSR